MKKTKSIIFFILAILPVIVILFNLLSGIIFDTSLNASDLSFGSIVFSFSASSVSVSYPDRSIVSFILPSFFSSGSTFESGTLVYSFVNSINILSNSFGFGSIPPTIFIASIYLIYYIFLTFISFLIDLLLLPIRLIERAFL